MYHRRNTALLWNYTGRLPIELLVGVERLQHGVWRIRKTDQLSSQDNYRAVWRNMYIQLLNNPTLRSVKLFKWWKFKRSVVFLYGRVFRRLL